MTSRLPILHKSFADDRRAPLRVAVFVMAGLMIVSAWSATSSTADGQDACQIGAVSSEEYQAIAAEIASQPAIDWQEVHGRAGMHDDVEEVVEAALRGRIQDAIASRGSSDQEVAAMHALMRSLGAEFMSTDLVRFSQRPSLRWAAVYHYRVDVNRLGVPRPSRPWGRIDIVFLTDDPPQTMGDLYQVAFHIPVPFSPNLSGRKEDLRQIRACPQIPAELELPLWHPRRQQRE